MNSWSQMVGGLNRLLPKEINANRFFWDSHWLEIWSNHQTTYFPLWDRMDGACLWTPFMSYHLWTIAPFALTFESCKFTFTLLFCRLCNKDFCSGCLEGQRQGRILQKKPVLSFALGSRQHSTGFRILENVKTISLKRIWNKQIGCFLIVCFCLAMCRKYLKNKTWCALLQREPELFSARLKFSR